MQIDEVVHKVKEIDQQNPQPLYRRVDGRKEVNRLDNESSKQLSHFELQSSIKSNLSP